ncbi:hypothetical protein ZOSMA_11G01170 [Zostera marina]|uniref:HMG box domain-containing protein n=1 Tax=Zostera marina TaxID=29655 RepID=A0A0K9Q1Q2_ZOSMR|nr:hypothetical protein ZOSMA_11G01170 [Zostera marina]
MAGSSSNPPRPRKRVEAETTPVTFKRAKNGSAFTKCEECNKDVPVALIDMHSCSLESRIRMHLESEIVETEIKKKSANKKKIVSKEKKVAKSKDPDAPKRPLTAFFIFMQDFRKEYTEANPDSKGGAHVAKEGGVRWKSLSKMEKQVYTDRAAEMKVEYEKQLKEYEDNEDDEVVEIDPDEQDVEEKDDKENINDAETDDKENIDDIGTDNKENIEGPRIDEKDEKFDGGEIDKEKNNEVRIEKLGDEVDNGKLEDEDVVIEEKEEDEKKTRVRRRLRKGMVFDEDED